MASRAVVVKSSLLPDRSCHVMTKIEYTNDTKGQDVRSQDAFNHDTELALAETAALVNTVELDGDTLVTLADLDDFLARHPWSGVIRRTHEELESVRALRPDSANSGQSRIATRQQLWSTRSSRRQMRGPTCPDTMSGTGTSTSPARTPLADRIAADAAMAFLDLIRADALGRLRICAAEDCEDVLVDLSKNSSKRYCDTGNCGNRTNVAAYRARKRQQKRMKPSRRAAVPPFAVMSILNRVAQLRAQGREVISLCAGEPSQGAPADVRRRAAELMVDRTPLGYTETLGSNRCGARSPHTTGAGTPSTSMKIRSR